MAVTYPTSVLLAMANTLIGLIDAGAGPGKLEIGTSGMAATLVTLTLADPCGTASGGVITFDTTPALTANATGTGVAAAARFRDSNNNDVITGLTVGEGTGDIQLVNTDINSGQPVTITAATHTVQ